MSQQTSPLGIFDSGIGGLTVLKRVLEELPHEDIIYLGDTARVPYGDKSPGAIIRYSLQNASFLSSQAIKLLIVACHTASAYAVDVIKDRYALPVIDVIEPAIDHAVKMTVTKKIAVLGTRATINSGIYSQKIQERLSGVEVMSLACPLFVPLVEEDFLFHPATTLIIREYLKPIMKKAFDTVILGCTHYPLLHLQIQQELGNDVRIIDSAAVCAKIVGDVLEKKSLKKNHLLKGNRKYYVSDDAEKFRRLGKNFLGFPIENVESFIFDQVST